MKKSFLTIWDTPHYIRDLVHDADAALLTLKNFRVEAYSERHWEQLEQTVREIKLKLSNGDHISISYETNHGPARAGSVVGLAAETLHQGITESGPMTETLTREEEHA